MEFCRKIGERYQDIKNRKLDFDKKVDLKNGLTLSDEELAGIKRDVNQLKAEGYEILSDMYKRLSLLLLRNYFELKEEPPKSTYDDDLSQILQISHFHLRDSDSFFNEAVKGTEDDSNIIKDYHRALNCYLKGDSEGFRGYILNQIRENPDDPYFDDYQFLKGIADFYKAGGRDSDWEVFHNKISRFGIHSNYLIDHGINILRMHLVSLIHKESTRSAIERSANSLFNKVDNSKFIPLTTLFELKEALFITKKMCDPDVHKKAVSIFVLKLLNFKYQAGENDFNPTHYTQYCQILSESMEFLDPEMANELIEKLKKEAIEYHKNGIEIGIGKPSLKRYYEEGVADKKRKAASLFYFTGNTKKAKELYDEIDERLRLPLVRDHPEDLLILDDCQRFLNEYAPKALTLKSIVKNIQIAGHFRRKAKKAREKES